MERVEYFRRTPAFWTLKPEHKLIARGVAIRLEAGQAEYGPDAETIWRAVDMPDPEAALSSGLRISGIASIAWAVINSVLTCSQSADLRPGEQLIIPPAVIYCLSAWMLAEGIVLLRSRRPEMLIVDGLTLLALGCVNIAGQALAVIGIMQLVWGVQRIIGWSKVTKQIADYKQLRQTMDAQAEALVGTSHSGAN